MSAAVAGAVAASMMSRGTTTRRIAYNSNYGESYHSNGEALNEYNKKYRVKHITYLMFLSRINDGMYENKFLEELVHEIYNNDHSSLSKFINLENIDTKFLYYLSPFIDDLILDVDRYLLSKPTINELFVKLSNTIKDYISRKENE